MTRSSGLFALSLVHYSVTRASGSLAAAVSQTPTQPTAHRVEAWLGKEGAKRDLDFIRNIFFLFSVTLCLTYNQTPSTFWLGFKVKQQKLSQRRALSWLSATGALQTGIIVRTSRSVQQEQNRYLRWEAHCIVCETIAESKKRSSDINTQWIRLCAGHGPVHQSTERDEQLRAWSTGLGCFILSWPHVRVMGLTQPGATDPNIHSPTWDGTSWQRLASVYWCYWFLHLQNTFEKLPYKSLSRKITHS